jgi:hypothetical protein
MTNGSADIGAYVVRDDGEIVENDAAKATSTAYFNSKRDYEAVERSFAGARIAKFFKEYPWLGTLTFALTAEAEYDDQGGYFRGVSAHVSNLSVADEASPPELIDGEEFDLGWVADGLSDELQEDAESVYAAFGDEYGYEDFEFTVKRDQIADLLAGAEINGATAFGRFFPGHQLPDRGAIAEEAATAESA